MGLENSRGNINDVRQNELAFGTNLELRMDTSVPGRTIFGYAEPGTAQTTAAWFIYAEDQVGTAFHRQYAEVASVPTADFVHKWSDRATIIANPAFMNEYSIQFSAQNNEYGIVSHSADIDFAATDGFSISVWFKTKNGTQTLFQKATSTAGDNGYTLRMDTSGRLEFEFRGTGTGDRIRVRTDGFVDGGDGSFHHVLITKASGSSVASTVKIYVDGNDETLKVRKDTLTGTTTSSSDLYFAANISGTTRYSGNMDEFSIWGVELTALEVIEVYNSNNGAIDLQAGTGQISSALNAWWRMGDGSFSVLPTVPDEEGLNDMTMQVGIVSGDLETVTPP